MKLLSLIGLGLLTLSTTVVAGGNPYCTYFRSIQSTVHQLDGGDVNRILPNADWLENQHRRRDQRAGAIAVGKTVVLLVIGRLSWFSYAITPTALGDGSATGYYSRNPQTFAKFLELNPTHACQYLSAPDRQADLLRKLTRDTYLTFRAAR